LVSIVCITAIALLGLTTSDAGATENGARAVLENHACAMVLGLNPSEANYDVCIRSLDNTLSRADNTQAVVNIHDACAKQGFNPRHIGFRHLPR